MHRAINIVRWGEHRGGMFVEVSGEAEGARVVRTWHMTAEGDDGPFIPSMACEAIIRHCVAGKCPAPGARPATGDLELEDYERLFARRAIHSGQREQTTASASLPLYRRLLGEAYDAMPAPLRAMHDLANEMTAEGTATVTRGKGLLARLAAAIVGFPQAGENVPVRVDFKVEHGRERWTRSFAGRAFHSTQEQGRGRFEWLVCERFGPLCAGMALVHRRRQTATDRATLQRVRHPAARVARAARQLVRIRRERTLPFSCRDRASVHGSHRRVSGMAGSTRVIALHKPLCQAHPTLRHDPEKWTPVFGEDHASPKSRHRKPVLNSSE